MLEKGSSIKYGKELDMSWFEGEKLDEYRTADFFAAVFNLWFEQKLFREVCKDQVGMEQIKEFDLGSIGLNINNEPICKHELLGDEEAVVHFTKCLLAKSELLIDNEVGESAAAYEDESSPIFDEKQQEILSHYIQTLIAIQEDPSIQIRKFAQDLYEKF